VWARERGTKNPGIRNRKLLRKLCSFCGRVAWLVVVLAVAIALQATTAVGQARGSGKGKSAKPKSSEQFPGFVDANGDGVNDLFVDRNGDGINDVTGKPYPHQFRFQDKNGDGINDLWVDKDGDGVNDLIVQVEFGKKGPKWVDVDGDGIQDRDVTLLLPPGRLWHHVLDANHDGKNDITGLPYRGPMGIMGYRFGRVDEEIGKVYKHFVDKNHDGMHDSALKYGWQRLGPRVDVFIDRDGDGICDDRSMGFGKKGGRGWPWMRGFGRGHGGRQRP